MDEDEAAWWARKLADNDAAMRRKAVRRLRRWLGWRSRCSDRVFTEEDMLKIWKGLFYCVWMCDKPLAQEELVADIAQILFALDAQDIRVLFVEAFFATTAREWAGIDQLRLDKYMMLVRRMMHVIFELLKMSEWNETLTQKFMELMMKYPANADETNQGVPLSLQNHVADVYVEELLRVGEKQLSPEIGNHLLEPYCRLMASTSSAVLLERVNRRVFEYAIRVTDIDVPKTEVVEGETDSSPKAKPNVQKKKSASYKQMVQGKVKEAMSVPLFSFNYVALADHLFELASSKQVARRNRSIMYKLIKRLKLLAEGHFPLDHVVPPPGKGLVPKHYRQATKRLLETQDEEREEKIQRKLAARNKKRRSKLKAS